MEMQRHLVAERLGGLEIDYQLELDRGLDGKLAWRRALEDAIGISCRALIIIQRIISVGQQATKFSEIAVRIDRRKMVESRQRCALRAMFDQIRYPAPRSSQYSARVPVRQRLFRVRTCREQ